MTPDNTDKQPRKGAVAAPFLGAIDRRTARAKTFARELALLVSHLGGADHISAVETGLCERLAGIHTLCREYETDHAAGREIDVDKYLAAASRYDRLAKTVGLHRVARDITPDLRDFMDAKPEAPS